MKKLIIVFALGVFISSPAFSQIQIDSIGNVGIGIIVPTTKLDVNGTTRIRTLSGSGLRPLFVDSIGNIMAQKLLSQNNSASASIPDDSCSGTVSTINISGFASNVEASEICVTLNISHTSINNLYTYLIAPNGDTLNLLYANGGSLDDLISTVFTDAGSSVFSGSPPYTGLYQPNGTLSPFACFGIKGTVSTFSQIGGGLLNPNGNWQLLVIDKAGGDVGILNDWTITFNKGGIEIGADNYIPKWSNGTLTEVSSIYDNGNVGIGTTAPTQKLDIDGKVRIRDLALDNTKDSILVACGDGTVAYRDASSLAETYSIGDFVQGGIVFWVDETGEHGLVCAKSDQSTGTKWYAGTFGNTQAKGDGPFSGEANTSIIIAAQVAIGDDNAMYAARSCNELQITEGGYTYGDWYLPSKYELNLMYINRATINATAIANGGVAFATSVYWSSTEGNNSFAWYHCFLVGGQFNNSKMFNRHVRAVRAF